MRFYFPHQFYNVFFLSFFLFFLNSALITEHDCCCWEDQLFNRCEVNWTINAVRQRERKQCVWESRFHYNGILRRIGRASALFRIYDPFVRDRYSSGTSRRQGRTHWTRQTAQKHPEGLTCFQRLCPDFVNQSSNMQRAAAEETSPAPSCKDIGSLPPRRPTNARWKSSCGVNETHSGIPLCGPSSVDQELHKISSKQNGRSEIRTPEYLFPTTWRKRALVLVWRFKSHESRMLRRKTVLSPNIIGGEKKKQTLQRWDAEEAAAEYESARSHDTVRTRVGKSKRRSGRSESSSRPWREEQHVLVGTSRSAYVARRSNSSSTEPSEN